MTVDGFGHPVTAVRTAGDDLRLSTWRVNANGSVQRLGDSGDLAGETQGHDIAPHPPAAWPRP
jgi:hypothetical protein